MNAPVKKVESDLEVRLLFRREEDPPEKVRVLVEPAQLGQREQHLGTVTVQRINKNEARLTIHDRWRGGTRTIPCNLKKSRTLPEVANTIVRWFEREVARESGKKVRGIRSI